MSLIDIASMQINNEGMIMNTNIRVMKAVTLLILILFGFQLVEFCKEFFVLLL